MSEYMLGVFIVVVDTWPRSKRNLLCVLLIKTCASPCLCLLQERNFDLLTGMELTPTNSVALKAVQLMRTLSQVE